MKTQIDVLRELRGKLVFQLIKLVQPLGWILIAASVELIFSFYFKIGILLYFACFFALIFFGYKAEAASKRNTCLALAIVPLIRIFSVAMPVSEIPLNYWYAIFSIPLFLSAFTTARFLRITPLSLGFSKANLPRQLLIGLLGLPLGWAGAQVFLTLPAGKSQQYPNIWFTAIILIVCTGFLEELIFRGILYQTVREQLGSRQSLFMVSFLNACLYISNLSWQQFIFVFLATMVLTEIFRRYRSLLGISLVHGLMNIVLFRLRTGAIASTVTTVTISCNFLYPNLIDYVGRAIVFTLIFLLMSKEFLPQVLDLAPLEKQKADFIAKLPDLAILPFLFVFAYIMVFHSLEVLK